MVISEFAKRINYITIFIYFKEIVNCGLPSLPFNYRAGIYASEGEEENKVLFASTFFSLQLSPGLYSEESLHRPSFCSQKRRCRRSPYFLLPVIISCAILFGTSSYRSNSIVNVPLPSVKDRSEVA